jgi:hypothetical protein
MEHVTHLILLVIFFIAVYYLIQLGKQGKTFNFRPIPAMDGLKEAVGRATEMGRPVFFIPGVQGVDTMEAHQTIAGLNILNEVADECAEKETELVCGSMHSTTVPLMEDILKISATKAGKPELYDSLLGVRYYGTRTQSPHWIAHIMNEKPAAYMYFGWCGAEDIMYIVPASRVGALCLGGTTILSHVGIVAAASDYFLIGEELHAAGAYTKGDPVLLNSFVTNDIIRSLSLIMMIIGLIAVTLGLATADTFSNLFKM